jgi:hypothetical protein
MICNRGWKVNTDEVAGRFRERRNRPRKNPLSP